MTGPTVLPRPGSWTFQWDDPYHVALRLDRVQRHSSGTVGCELHASSGSDPLSEQGFLLHARLNDMLGTRIRADTIKALSTRFDLVPWADYLDIAIEHTLREVRAGAPMVPLIDVPFSELNQWRLWPILREGQPTVLFGYGGSLKSMIGGLYGVRVALGIDAEPGNVLVLDWESTQEDWHMRQAMIATGLEVEEPPNMYYRRCSEPLAAEVEAVKELVGEHAIDFLIIDSAAYACGEEPERAGPVTEFYRSVRAIGLTTLIVAHQNRDEKSQRPYGSIFFENAARSTIQVRKSEEQTTSTTVGLFNRKVNGGRPFNPFSIVATFHQFKEDEYTTGDSVVFKVGALASIPDLAPYGSATDKVLAALLEAETPMAPSALAGITGLRSDSVRQAVHRLAQRGMVEIVGGLYSARKPSEEGA